MELDKHTCESSGACSGITTSDMKAIRDVHVTCCEKTIFVVPNMIILPLEINNMLSTYSQE